MNNAPIFYENNYWYKLCPVCNGKIRNRYKSQLRQKTCSHACQLKGNKFRMGKIPTNAWKKGDTSGERNTNWKGDNVGYDALHDWVKRKLGTPMQCSVCGGVYKNPKQMNWANKSKKYKRNINDWVRLCKKCHFQFDKESYKSFIASSKRPIKMALGSKSGFKNVRITAQGRYRAYISIKKKQVHLGNFDTAEEAYKAYKAKALELYGYY